MSRLDVYERMNKIFDWCLDWIWPRYCLGCGKEGEWVCDICLHSRVGLEKDFCCPECRLKNHHGEVCQNCREKWDLDRLVVACYPTDLLRKILLEYKYKDIYRLGDILVNLLSRKIGKRILKYDYVTCVPLHPKREKWRGYNQAAILAERLAWIYKIPFLKIINRKKYGIPQVNFDRRGRRKNVNGVFELVKKIDLVAKRILIVDDVCTTGATIDECAKVLKASGAERVDGLVVVRGTMRK